MANRAVFIDRDGTLLEHVPYITKRSEVKLKPNIGRALGLLRDRGYLLVLITNQSGVARGYLTEDTLSEIHDELKSQLNEQGVWLDQIYYCPYHPNAALPEYRENSPLRKPSPGMLKLASTEMEIDLVDSWMIGDDDRDVEAGQGAGCKTIFIESYNVEGVKVGNSNPDFKVVNFQEAANVIIRQDKISATVVAASEANTAFVAESENEPENEPESEPENEKAYGESCDTEQALKGSQPSGLLKEIEDDAEKVIPKTAETFQTPVTTLATNTPKEKKRKKVKRVKVDKNISSEKNNNINQDDIQVQILRELKALNRQNEFNDFSIVKMVGAVMQMVVVLFLILTVMATREIHPDQSTIQSLLVAGGLFQLITLSCWVANKSK